MKMIYKQQYYNCKRMSVYITIKAAALNARPPSPVYLLIQSSTAVLKSLESPSSNSPFWQSSFVCSIRQRYLHFRLCCDPFYGSNKSLPSQWSIQSEMQNKTLALGELPFQYFQNQPDHEVLKHLQLVSQTDKGFKKQGYLELLIRYEPAKNYLGQMEFYEIGNGKMGDINSYSRLKAKMKQTKHSPSNKNIFIPIKQSKIHGSQTRKNIFNCCDRPVHEEQNEIITPHYFHH